MTRLVVVLIVVTAALAALDISLERLERREVEQEAEGFYRQGHQREQQHDYAGAVESYRRAYILERKNPAYRLALAASLTSATRYEDARGVLDEALRFEPTSARANLLNARLFQATGDLTRAAIYYHRAIYGTWSDDPVRHRIQAREELLKILTDRRQRQAELLPLEAEYRNQLEQSPDNTAFLAGLGNTLLESGRYAEAQVAFLRAYKNSPQDAAARHGLELTSALSALDPTARRMPSRVKFERSTRILKLVRDALGSCSVTTPEPEDVEPSNDAAERQLQQAEDLWKGRPATCQGSDLVNLIVEKLSLQ